MKFGRLFGFLLTASLVVSGSSCALAQGEAVSQESSPSQQASQLKAIKEPMAPYPEEAEKKGIEGKVTLSIVVDAGGRVSDAKVLSGPPELIQAALDSVKMWQYEPPKSAPVTRTIWVSYGFPEPCPGPVSERGAVYMPGGLRNDKGLLLGPVDYATWRSPRYPDEDRKAGVAGDMVLAVTVNPKGEVTNVRVVKSLSPHLDKVAIDTARTWKYKVMKGNPEDLPSEFTLRIRFEPMCDPKF
jgi:TonB family protein